MIETIKHWLGKNNSKSEPFTAEKAYALYCSNTPSSNVSFAKILNDTKENIVKKIKHNAEMHELYTLYYFPEWMTYSTKNELKSYIHSLGYNIVYSDTSVMLITAVTMIY